MDFEMTAQQMATPSSHSTWESTWRSLLHFGLFEQHGIDKEKAIRILANGDESVLAESDKDQNNQRTKDAFAMRIDEYMKKSSIVGLFEGVEDSECDILRKALERKTIVVISGIPRPSLLYKLGTQFDLDIKPFLESYEIPHTFRIESLPSRRTEGFTVKFISLGTCVSALECPPRSSKIEEMLVERMNFHYRECLKGKNVGMERCRFVNLHDSHIFSVEQQASFLTFNHDEDGSWSGILLHDFGRSHSPAPWIPPPDPYIKAQFYPISPSGRCSMSRIAKKLDRGTRQGRYEHIFSQPNPFLSRFYTDVAMSEGDQKLCQRDPFVFLSDLLETSALSWLQGISYLRASHANLPESPILKGPRLRADKLLLDRAVRYFAAAISYVEKRPNAWKTSKRGQEIAKLVIADFSHLKREAEDLSNQCTELLSIAMSESSILESQKSLSTARSVQLLTYLAFVFIPMTYIASCFGMNVKELGPEGPGLWLYFAIALPTTIVMLIVPVWMEKDKLGGRLTEGLRGRVKE